MESHFGGWFNAFYEGGREPWSKRLSATFFHNQRGFHQEREREREKDPGFAGVPVFPFLVVSNINILAHEL